MYVLRYYCIQAEAGGTLILPPWLSGIKTQSNKWWLDPVCYFSSYYSTDLTKRYASTDLIQHPLCLKSVRCIGVERCYMDPFMTSVKLYSLHMHPSFNLLQLHFIDAKPNTRSKSLNKMVCVDSRNGETPNTLQREWVSTTPKCLQWKKSLNKYIMMELE